MWPHGQTSLWRGISLHLVEISTRLLYLFNMFNIIVVHPDWKVWHKKEFIYLVSTPVTCFFIKKKIILWEFHTMYVDHIHLPLLPDPLYPPNIVSPFEKCSSPSTIICAIHTLAGCGEDTHWNMIDLPGATALKETDSPPPASLTLETFPPQYLNFNYSITCINLSICILRTVHDIYT